MIAVSSTAFFSPFIRRRQKPFIFHEVWNERNARFVRRERDLAFFRVGEIEERAKKERHRAIGVFVVVKERDRISAFRQGLKPKLPFSVIVKLVGNSAKRPRDRA